MRGAPAQRPFKLYNGAIRRKAYDSCDRTRTTSTSNGWCSSLKTATKKRPHCGKSCGRVFFSRRRGEKHVLVSQGACCCRGSAPLAKFIGRASEAHTPTIPFVAVVRLICD